MHSFSVELAGPESLEVLLDHRMRMWKEIRPGVGKSEEIFAKMTRKWISAKLEEGSMTAMLVRSNEGTLAGSGCILIQEDQPRPGSLLIKRPYLLSMYTEKPYRNQGVATMIVQNAIKWAREHGYDRMTLHASEFGRHMYEKAGFRQTNEMQLFLH